MKSKKWQEIDWQLAYNKVRQIQEDIIKAWENKEHKYSYELQRKLITSWEASALAVRRVTTSEGAKTPGLDKILWDSPIKKYRAIEEIHNIAKNPKLYWANPVKRVYIPKPGSTEQRPLGIPTLLDRGMQALYCLAVDPIVELQSDEDSYGFRLYRSTHDCITRIRTLIDKKHSPTWLLETDISKCFDNIDHEYLLKHTPICDKMVLREWLKSGAMEGKNFIESLSGTPQGGVILPMLCNVALNGMEKYIKDWAKTRCNKRGEYSKTHVIRYADDIIILSKTQEMCEGIKLVLETFLSIRGLKVKESKTSITNVEKGFDFLGFNIRKRPLNLKHNAKKTQDTVIIVKPSKNSEIKLRKKLKEITKQYSKPIEGIIQELNPVLRGWSEYFRISYHSQPIFWKMGHYVWTRIMRWIRGKHSKKNFDRSLNKYLQPHQTYKWVFGKSVKEKIFNISEVTSWKPSLIKFGCNPYIQKNREYFEKRQEIHIIAKFRSAVYKKYKQKCPECGESLHNGENIELHHQTPQKEGGSWKLDNIMPLHEVCHKAVTYKYELKKKKLD